MAHNRVAWAVGYQLLWSFTGDHMVGNHIDWGLMNVYNGQLDKKKIH